MQRWSKLFIPTLREAPADAEVASHKFLVRAGYIRQLAAGIYSYLFLAQRTILKITGIVREEMDTIGQELYLPALNPREVWEASGRWSVMGDNMFRLKDRKGADLCLGMTHEEIMTDIARKELRSYKQLPQIWYQIQTKFRDEPRPKSGLLRVRQFTMKDSYSFDLDRAGLDKSFDLHDAAYRRIFKRCGLDFVAVEADSGSMGGSQSQEFMVYTDAGEDLVASCAKCGYAANLEKATSRLEAIEDTQTPIMREVLTPGMKTIAEVSEFLRVPETSIIKSLAYMATYPAPDGASSGTSVPVLVLMRGDKTLNEAKLAALIHAQEVRPMAEDEIPLLGAPAGFIGPVGLKAAVLKTKFDVITLLDTTAGAIRIVLDETLKGRTNLVAGANKHDHHFLHVQPGRDFSYTQEADVSNVVEGEGCPRCGEPLKLGKTVEIGHIFKLGTKYSESMGATVLDKDGKEQVIIMGSYGIGVERILTSCVEQNHDDNGFWLSPAIAPFNVVVAPMSLKDAAQVAAAEKLCGELEAAGYDVLLDDRDERPGVKFKDADLVGIPFRVNIGKLLAEGKLELVERSGSKKTEVPVGELLATLQALYNPRA